MKLDDMLQEKNRAVVAGIQAQAFLDTSQLQWLLYHPDGVCTVTVLVVSNMWHSLVYLGTSIQMMEALVIYRSSTATR